MVVLRLAVLALAWLAAAGCAAQGDVADPAAEAARSALADLARLAQANAPRAQFDAPLAPLRTTLEELGIDVQPGATRTASTAPVRPGETQDSPPPRPTPAELDRRQRDLGAQLPAGPAPPQQAWRAKMDSAWEALANALATEPLDHERVAAAVERLQSTLARRPPPD